MKLSGVMLFCKDIKGLTAFYKDVLGLVPDEPQPFPAHKFFRFKFKNGTSLCLHSGTKPNEGRQKLMFDVKSVQDVYERLKKSGSRVKKPVSDDDILCYDFKDPEGNRIQIYGPL